MTQLIALSFDCETAPSIRLKAIDAVGQSLDSTYGWGFAWYPTAEQAAMVIKDPSAVSENALSSVLSRWERFSSTLFLAHLRGAAKRRSQKDTHPFCRPWGGRDWLFTHNGDLKHRFRDALPLPPNPVFEPLGSTDSEYAFCWLLEKVRSVGARRIRDVEPNLFHSWLRQINEQGTANLLIADGLDLVAYSDSFGYRPLWWTRRTPPDSTILFENEEVAMRLGSKIGESRTLIVISTSPLSDSGWSLIGDGGLLRVSRGGVMEQRSSEATQELAPSQPQPASVPQSQLGAHVHSASAPIPGAAINDVQASPGARNSDDALADNDGIASSDDEALAKASSQLNAPEVMDAGLAREADEHATGSASGQRVMETVHETTFRYDAPVESSWHMFRFRPIHDQTQEVVDYQLSITPQCPHRTFEDVFGNHTVEMQINKPYEELKIVSRAKVILHTDLATKLRSGLHSQRLPLVWMPWQRQMMLPYLLPPELPETQLRELSDYAMSFVERQDHDLVDTLKDINRTIFRDYQYATGSTTLQTTPFDVYTTREGVCQDFANLFIAMARLLSIPARYKVGYIFTGSKYQNARQGDESHAWVEVYLPSIGWRGFDPTNGVQVGADHIRVAHGRNYSDASPTTGTIYSGGGAETMSVRVEVRDVTNEQPG